MTPTPRMKTTITRGDLYTEVVVEFGANSVAWTSMPLDVTHVADPRVENFKRSLAHLPALPGEAA